VKETSQNSNMRITVTIIRILTGILFIFSGLIKAIDPKGLAYKMKEFFEAFANDGYFKGMMNALEDHALTFSIIMITLEVIVGVALLLGWQKKLTTWILLLLMLLFTFLTSYVLFSGKIRACGCFGDCIPITPKQTFTKDIILLVFALILLLNTKYIRPVAKPLINSLCILVATILTLMLQFHVMKHLPLIDCLPFKKGNDILKLREMPADAVPDKFDYKWIYEKDGVKKEFTTDALPDSTWTFSDRKQVLVAAGKNNIPLINDFSLNTADGADVTEMIMNTPDEYYLFFLEFPSGNTNKWIEDFRTLIAKAATRKVYLVTSQRNAAEQFLQKNNINTDAVYTCDATAIKTAARSNPTLYLMQGAVVKEKWGWADLEEASE
jgi:uncharacterized membrane protein YphA (DoxX/SURF4 family)